MDSSVGAKEQIPGNITLNCTYNEIPVLVVVPSTVVSVTAPSVDSSITTTQIFCNAFYILTFIIGTWKECLRTQANTESVSHTTAIR